MGFDTVDLPRGTIAALERGLGNSRIEPVAEPNRIREHVPEGDTRIWAAPQRYGKTLGMVIFALNAWQNGRTVWSNIQLGFPHERLEFEDVKLETGTSKFYNGHINIDELNFYFDARRSMSGKNLNFGAQLLQQKKQGCELSGTTHGLEYLDVRLREHYDYLHTPSVYPKFPAAPQILKVVVENGPLQARFRRTLVLDCRPFLGLYDSFAVYDPFRKVKEERDDPPVRRGSRVKLDE